MRSRFGSWARVVAALWFAWAAPRVAAAEDVAEQGGMVLPPEAAPALQTALRRMEPELRFRSASIEKNRVVLELCPATGECLPAILTHPAPDCARRLGPWCVAFPARAATEGELAVMTRGLSPDPETLFWKFVAPAAKDQSSATYRPSLVSPYALAPLYLLFPIALGIAAGFALRRLLRRRLEGRRLSGRRSAALLVALPPVLLAWGGAYALFMGVWDLAALGLLFSLAAFAVAHEAATRLKPKALAFSVVLALVLGEGAARLVLPPPPAFPPPDEARLFVSYEGTAAAEWLQAFDWRDLACDAMYPTEKMRFKGVPEADPERPRRVLHLGDSMVFGTGVEEAERFTTLLAEREPGVDHVNLGLPSTSADVQFLAMREWLDDVNPEAIVYYFFTGNDLAEIDMPMPCCQAGPVLTYGEAGPEARCPERIERGLAGMRVAWLVSESPPPYPMRVATGFSALARHTSAAFIALSQKLGTPAGQSEEKSWAHARAVVGAMQEEAARRGIPFVAVVVPFRAGLEEAAPKKGSWYLVRRQALEMFGALGVPALDPWDMFEQLVQRDGSEAWFTDFGRMDPHLNPEGHAQLAGWLAQRLPAALATAKAKLPPAPGAPAPPQDAAAPPPGTGPSAAPASVDAPK